MERPLMGDPIKSPGALEAAARAGMAMFGGHQNGGGLAVDASGAEDGKCSMFSHQSPVFHPMDKPRRCRKDGALISPFASPSEFVLGGFASPQRTTSSLSQGDLSESLLGPPPGAPGAPPFASAFASSAATMLGEEGGLGGGLEFGFGGTDASGHSALAAGGAAAATAVAPLAAAEALGERQERSTYAVRMHGLIYGGINFIVCVPTLVSYAAIVFRLRAFEQDMPSLTKLFFLSSAIHQLVFTLASSLPFAIGQVQDVGLIFLSQIATGVYYRVMRAPMVPAAGAIVNGTAPPAPATYDEALATVLVACALATFFTGCVVWLVGRLKLSGYVQLLPLPVVGGYLGYIGYFCLAAGASIGTGLTIEGFATWEQVLVWDVSLLCKLGLTLSFALLLFYIAYRVEHVMALPAVLTLTPILFFVILYFAGISIEEARAAGWVPYPDPDPASGMQCISLFNGLTGIRWSAIFREWPTFVGLFCVVAFGSVLDIAAIQTAQPGPLDFDGELKMIGLANMASGALGGFTGSYIFSQTIFSQRQGVSSILNGFVVFVGEFALFLAPFDVLQFFPGVYIGGVMAFFGVDIMYDWFGHSKSKVSAYEYTLLIATYLFVMFLGVIPGCVAGVAASAAMFIIVYSRTPAVDIRHNCCSTAMRSFEERTALLDLQRSIVVIELRGHLFFGASLQVSDGLLRDIGDLGVEWAVLDFTHVSAVDSTSARALAKLVSVLRLDGVRVAFAGASEKAHVRRLLRENGAWPTEEDLQGALATLHITVDGALAWCERGALRNAGVAAPGDFAEKLALMEKTQGGMGKVDLWEAKLTRLLQEFVEPPPRSISPSKGGSKRDNEARLLASLAGRLERQIFRAGESLFEAGASSDWFMLLVEGTALSQPISASPSRTPSMKITPSEAAAAQAAGVDVAPRTDRRSSLGGILFTFETGALLGETDFYLGRPRSYTARAGPEGCQAAVFTSLTIEQLEAEEPKLALLMQRIALRSVCLLVEATEGLFPKGPWQLPSGLATRPGARGDLRS